MINRTELWRAGAGELARAIRTRQVSSREVVEAHLRRIEQVNPRVNAITHVLAEQALAEATAADARLARGDAVGPLHGVPFTTKENIDLGGCATTQGVARLAGAVAPGDAPHVAQLRMAGAIPLARTNMPDFGLRWHTDSGLYGATRNPWDPRRTPGGSSGGEAVALATGMSPLGLGNDYGGSLRVPAQFCGVAALKPTLGRIASASLLEPRDRPLTQQLFAVQGPLARRIEDLELALEAMSGPDPRDPWWAPAPLRGPAMAHPIGVAVCLAPGGQGADADVAVGVRRAAAALRATGYRVEEIGLPAVAEAADLWSKLTVADTQLAHVRLPERLAALVLARYANGFAARGAIARAWSELQMRWPLVLGPVSTRPAFPVGLDEGDEAQGRGIVQSMRLAVTVNLLGLPAVALPVGVAAGLPQGVQIIGPRYREDLCLEAARAVESELGMLTPIEPRE